MPETSALDPPYIVTKGSRTYFVATDGSAWRVRDTCWDARRHLEVKLGSANAKYRLFTTPDGKRQVYEFTGDERRVVSEQDLERQLRLSRCEPRNQSPDPDARSLGASEGTMPTVADLPHRDQPS